MRPNKVETAVQCFRVSRGFSSCGNSIYNKKYLSVFLPKKDWNTYRLKICNKINKSKDEFWMARGIIEALRISDKICKIYKLID